MGDRTQPTALLLMYPCGCGNGLAVCFPADYVGRLVKCSHTGREMHVIGEVFGPEQWWATARVGHLEACADTLGLSLSPRQARLAVCHWSRGQCELRSNEWDWEALAEGERWAETGVRPVAVETLLRRRAAEQLGGHHAHVCVGESPRLPASDPYTPPGIKATDAYRDVTPNPFVPLAWNPEWLTSTVRDLAAHVYESREFHLIPVLGDALQDAGCGDEQVLDHCRADKPHARGCWVVDAILGKT